MHAQTWAAGVLVLCLLLSGCVEGPFGGEGEVIPVEARELDHGQQSGITQEERLVITSQLDWDEFWQMHSSGLGDEEAPEVDFSSERVIAATMGERPNGCYGIRITEVGLDAAAGQTRVNVTSKVPGPEEMCTQSLVHPYHFVAVADDGTEVVFEEHETEGPLEE